MIIVKKWEYEIPKVGYMNRQEILTYVYYSNANLQPILHVTSQSL
jgi:hypothetical protein